MLYSLQIHHRHLIQQVCRWVHHQYIRDCAQLPELEDESWGIPGHFWRFQVFSDQWVIQIMIIITNLFATHIQHCIYN